MLSSGKYLWQTPEGYSRLVWLKEPAKAAFWEDHWTLADLRQTCRDAQNDRVLRPILERLFAHPDALVLEGGCGVAQWVALLGDRGTKILGLDYARQTLARVKGWRSDLPLVAGDLLHLPVRDGALTGYISLGVVEHCIAGPGEMLAECARVVAMGKLLVVGVPYFSPLRRLKALIGSYRRYPGVALPEDLFYQYAFTPCELRAQLCAHGFDLVATVPYDVRGGLMRELPDLARLTQQFVSPRQPWAAVAVAKGVGLTSGRRKVATIREVIRTLADNMLVRQFAAHSLLCVARRGL